MTIVETLTNPEPRKAALTFSAVLAADLGVPSEVEETSEGFLVVADDGKAILFKGI